MEKIFNTKKMNDLTYDFWCYFSGYILTPDFKMHVYKILHAH